MAYVAVYDSTVNQFPEIWFPLVPISFIGALPGHVVMEHLLECVLCASMKMVLDESII